MQPRVSLNASVIGDVDTESGASGSTIKPPIESIEKPSDTNADYAAFTPSRQAHRDSSSSNSDSDAETGNYFIFND